MKKTGENKKKGFLSNLIEKLDKKMEESARSKPCCPGKDIPEKESCCDK